MTDTSKPARSVRAGDLAAHHLGLTAEIAETLQPGGVTARLTGRIVAVSHDTDETTLEIAGTDSPDRPAYVVEVEPGASVTLLDRDVRPVETRAAITEAVLPPHTRDTVAVGRSYRVGPDPTWHGRGGVCAHEGIDRDDGGLRTGDIVEVQSTRPNDPDVRVRFVDPETGAHHQTYVDPACLDLHPVTTRDDLVAGREYRVVRQPYWWSVDGTRVGYDWSAFPSVVTVVGLRSDVTEASSRHDPDVAVAGSAFAAGTYLDPECLDPVPVDA